MQVSLWSSAVASDEKKIRFRTVSAEMARGENWHFCSLGKRLSLPALQILWKCSAFPGALPCSPPLTESCWLLCCSNLPSRRSFSPACNIACALLAWRIYAGVKWGGEQGSREASPECTVLLTSQNGYKSSHSRVTLWMKCYRSLKGLVLERL